MKKVIIGILAVAVLAMGGLLVFAQSSEGIAADGAKKMDRKGRHHFGKRGGYGFMFRGIDLTDDQKAQMKAIREANKAQTAPLMEAMKANRQKMQEATANGMFDEGTVTVIANEQAAIMAKMTVERERVRSQMFGILTAEQKAKMAEMKAKFAENKGKFRNGKSGKRGFHKKGGAEKPAETN
jgi:protein CpxP